jgi:hypothetical protein
LKFIESRKIFALLVAQDKNIVVNNKERKNDIKKGNYIESTKKILYYIIRGCLSRQKRTEQSGQL